jgi:HAD superfamily hydrolase (TIGR01509 family)
MIRALLFDMDGTLVDTEQQTMDAIQEVMTSLGHPEIKVLPSEACGRSWTDIANRLATLAERPALSGQIEEQLARVWNRLVAIHAKPIPGIKEALILAQRSGLKIGVVSSSTRDVIDTLLNTIDISSLISSDARVGADNVEKFKPHPEGFLKGASLLGVSPSECLVFEDSSSGLRAAQAAGMLCVAVLHGSKERELARSLADASIVQYGSLPPRFFEEMMQSNTPKDYLLGFLP